MKKVAIIGGGVSGVTFALNIQDYAHVTIFEREHSLLLKLLKTGNGKANIYNRNIELSAYNDHSFMNEHYNLIEVTLDEYFKRRGLLTYTDEEGRVYPYSRSAKGLKDFLLKDLKVEVKTATNVTNVIKEKNGYIINGEYYDYLVLATGSSAGLFKYPLDNNNDPLLNSLKLARSALVPVIKTIKVKENLKLLHNNRSEVVMSLWMDGTLLFKEKGEVLFKEDGLSGIVSFVVSSYFEWAYKEHPKANYKITLDLIPDLGKLEIKEILKTKDDYDKVFAPFMVSYLKTLKGDNILNNVKALSFTPVALNNPENTQALSGGVLIEAITNDFNLKNDPNLFVLGEVLNIDGICGGYNLGFAIYSGIRSSKALLYKLSK
ncbi:MAG: NAD(P)/FAD-dependent oxidoreductase [Bacilli bacterium]|nr:NAD(P)/FAD-dependent oxidoreductase [Bacilli bacterium]